MIAVVDASVIVNTLTGRPQQELLNDRSRYALTATVAHFDAELGSALRGLWLGRHLSREDFRSKTMSIPDLPILRYPLDGLLGRIVDLSSNATFYDAAYIALAESFDADLLTADKRLAAVPGVACNVIVV